MPSFVDRDSHEVIGLAEGCSPPSPHVDACLIKVDQRHVSIYELCKTKCKVLQLVRGNLGYITPILVVDVA